MQKLPAADTDQHIPMGARMMSGHTDLHEQLQTELADFVQSCYYCFGYQGMVSTIDALVSKDDVITRCRYTCLYY
jgi:glycine C-acetyltransferase